MQFWQILVDASLVGLDVWLYKLDMPARWQGYAWMTTLLLGIYLSPWGDAHPAAPMTGIVLCGVIAIIHESWVRIDLNGFKRETLGSAAEDDKTPQLRLESLAKVAVANSAPQPVVTSGDDNDLPALRAEGLHTIRNEFETNSINLPIYLARERDWSARVEIAMRRSGCTEWQISQVRDITNSEIGTAAAGANYGPEGNWLIGLMEVRLKRLADVISALDAGRSDAHARLRDIVTEERQRGYAHWQMKRPAYDGVIPLSALDPMRERDEVTRLSTTWQDLSNRFRAIHGGNSVSMDWHQSPSGIEKVSLRGSSTARQETESLCGLAGAQLVSTPSVLRSASELVRAQSDNVQRWLHFVKEKNTPDNPVEMVSIVDGREVHGFYAGRFNQFPAACSRACVDCAATVLSSGSGL